MIGITDSMTIDTDDHWEMMLWLEEEQLWREQQRQLDEDEEIELQRALEREELNTQIQTTL